jgi:hypothetical protein
MNKIIFSEEKYIPNFDVESMISKVVDKYISTRPKENYGYVLFEKPIYEKVNDKLWYIYFTTKSPEAHWGKRFYQLVMGFGCIEEYYFNSNITDLDVNYSLNDLKVRFRNYLNMLLEDSKEVEEPLDDYEQSESDPNDDDYDYHQDELDRIEMEALDDRYVEELRPKYVVASTNSLMEETMVFTADEHGDIISYGGLNSIALRYGNDNWQDAFAAVNQLNTDEYKYIHIKKIIGTNTDNVHNLFMRITTADNLVI